MFKTRKQFSSKDMLIYLGLTKTVLLLSHIDNYHEKMEYSREKFCLEHSLHSMKAQVSGGAFIESLIFFIEKGKKFRASLMPITQSQEQQRLFDVVYGRYVPYFSYDYVTTNDLVDLLKTERLQRIYAKAVSARQQVIRYKRRMRDETQRSFYAETENYLDSLIENDLPNEISYIKSVLFARLKSAVSPMTFGQHQLLHSALDLLERGLKEKGRSLWGKHKNNFDLARREPLQKPMTGELFLLVFSALFDGCSRAKIKSVLNVDNVFERGSGLLDVDICRVGNRFLMVPTHLNSMSLTGFNSPKWLFPGRWCINRIIENQQWLICAASQNWPVPLDQKSIQHSYAYLAELDKGIHQIDNAVKSLSPYFSWGSIRRLKDWKSSLKSVATNLSESLRETQKKSVPDTYKYLYEEYLGHYSKQQKGTDQFKSILQKFELRDSRITLSEINEFLGYIQQCAEIDNEADEIDAIKMYGAPLIHLIQKHVETLWRDNKENLRGMLNTMKKIEMAVNSLNVVCEFFHKPDKKILNASFLRLGQLYFHRFKRHLMQASSAQSENQMKVVREWGVKYQRVFSALTRLNQSTDGEDKIVQRIFCLFNHYHPVMEKASYYALLADVSEWTDELFGLDEKTNNGSFSKCFKYNRAF